MKPLNLALVFLFSIWALPVWAFFDRDVHLLTMQDGLSNNTILSIYKDREGFMWFGTNTGLSRYDGRTIKNFCYPHSYYMNISDLTELSETHLGIIANNKLFCFDRNTERFLPLYFQSGSNFHISHILPVDDSSFWAISGDTLLLYRHKKNDMSGSTSIYLHVEKSYTRLISPKESFRAITYSSDKRYVCLATNRGNLVIFPPETPDLAKRIQLINGNVNVSSILCNKGIVWVSTLQQGILRYDISTGEIEQLTYKGEGKSGGISHTDVYKVIPMEGGKYLAVTWDGYTLLTPEPSNPWKITTEIFKDTASQLNRNLESRMISAYYDPNGILWIGTNGGGVMYSDLRLQFYKQYHQKRHNEICSILMDNEKRLWLATYHQGIMRSISSFDESRKLSFEIVGNEEVRQRQTVLCAFKEEEDNLWFGNKDGTLTSYNKATQQFKVHSLYIEGQVNHSHIWSLYIDSEKRFWIGTNNGLLLFDNTLKHGTRVPLKDLDGSYSQLTVKAIAGMAGNKVIGIGTMQGGFYKIMINEEGHITAQNGYENKANMATRSVRSLFAASDGNFYIGYEDGFLIFSPETDQVLGFYTIADGLCSNFIGCIAEDNKGRIWLGNKSGISRYSRHQHLFYNYYISGSNRSVLAYNHFLFWGNNKNLTYFDINELETRLADDKVLITGLEVDSRQVDIGKSINGQVILQKSISCTKSIVLDYENRDLSLSFNNLSYAKSLQKYNYRLFPYQENWSVSNNGEKASYTNLPAGKYLFEVKNIYPDLSLGKVTTLEIIILPHWSQTIWFRLFIILLLAGALYYLYSKMKMRQKRLEHELRMEHELFVLGVERDKEKQIRIERENFFTSAAHELRTPLTLILSPLQSLLSSISPDNPVYAPLAIMYRNGKSLHTLVDRLLYVQKIEAGMVKLHLSQANMTNIVKEVTESFLQTAALRQLDFSITLPDEAIDLWIDVEKITSAVRNLLSNAFKYTPPNGKIAIVLNEREIDGGKYCCIKVSDTGPGIEEDVQKTIFESFVTGENRPGFSTKAGIGLYIVKNTLDLHHGLVTLKSSPQQGSEFTLLIPEGKEHFANDEYEMIESLQVEQETFLLAEAKPEIKEEKDKKRKHLLVIDDNRDIRQYVYSLFCEDYCISEASNGEEGIQIALEKSPDLIISDIMMPVKDGFTCCRELREQPQTAHIPILMLTAKAEDADMLHASRVGADDYMMKPFNPEVLKSKVRNLILQRERLKRIYTKTLMLKQQENAESAEGEMADDFIQQVIRVIEANLSDENFNVKMLADQMNMSQPTLYRKIKQRSELAAIEMIRSVRMSKAASLLMENRYSMQEITEMVGYSDTRTLRKHFTEQFGVSPSKYIDKE